MDDAFRAYLAALDVKKPVIACGDLNVAHQEIDLKNPSPTGATLVSPMRSGASSPSCWLPVSTDTFRHLHPDATGAYSWWSYRFNARKNNAGWRIDYFLVSNRMAAPSLTPPFIAIFLVPTTALSASHARRIHCDDQNTVSPRCSAAFDAGRCSVLSMPALAFTNASDWALSDLNEAQMLDLLPDALAIPI